MIYIILYTLILLFIEREAMGTACLEALTLWYETMIPALFPMMIISSVLVDMGCAQKLGRLLNKTILCIFRISNTGCYCMITGFLFGFPLGAKTTADMYAKQTISKTEAEYLLSFANCLGPMYTINFIHSLFIHIPLWQLLVGIYASALFYGLCLRYTIYRNYTFTINCKPCNPLYNIGHNVTDSLYQCIPACSTSILLLGCYMVLFQLFFITLNHLLKSINCVTDTLYPLIEVTGGLLKLSNTSSLSRVLFYASFTGCCCHMQTYSFLKPAGLSIKKYIYHKIILSLISVFIGICLNCFYMHN